MNLIYATLLVVCLTSFIAGLVMARSRGPSKRFDSANFLGWTMVVVSVVCFGVLCWDSIDKNRAKINEARNRAGQKNLP